MERTKLIDFLESQGFFLDPKGGEENEGFISQAQKDQYTQQLARYPGIQTLAEVGFNAGHSAEHFFHVCKELKLLVAFDLNCYPYTGRSVDYFFRAYPSRFSFSQGDSLTKVPEFIERFPAVKFDLIYIDGCHLFEWAVGDILNAKKMAHPETLLWIDDVEGLAVGAAVNFCERLHFIEVEERFISEDPHSGKRSWLQAKFIF